MSSTSSMKCPACGGENRADLRFCGHCGLMLKEAPSGSVIAPRHIAPQRSAPRAQPRRRDGIIALASIGFLVLLCGGLAAWSSGRNNPTPATAPTAPAPALAVVGTVNDASPGGRIQTLVAYTVQKYGGKQILTLDAAPLPATGRYYVELHANLASEFGEEAAKSLAYYVHRVLWTSGLAIGAVQVWVYPSSVTQAAGGKVLVNARAGYELMHTQDWSGSGPTVWANFLQQHAYVGGDEESAVWFHGPGGQ